ncbi:MAG: hypothetical protein ACLFSG_04515, partial [Halothiobacillaceae bacterium]
MFQASILPETWPGKTQATRMPLSETGLRAPGLPHEGLNGAFQTDQGFNGRITKKDAFGSGQPLPALQAWSAEAGSGIGLTAMLMALHRGDSSRRSNRG